LFRKSWVRDDGSKWKGKRKLREEKNGIERSARG